jgi:hypothetical protein
VWGLDAEIYEKKNKVMSYYCGTIENHILYFGVWDVGYW